MSGKVYPLKDEQALAVDPRDSVWLSASAGTGKTQVLSARVLRLLLTEGVEPGQILCLTFTKAGAAEMATRVNEVLANWVRMDDAALGERPDRHRRARHAREHRPRPLAVRPGARLPRRRPQDRHDPRLLAMAARRVPEEAGLIPGTKPMEDRDKDLLAHRGPRRAAGRLAGAGRHGDARCAVRNARCAWAPTACAAG